MFRGSAYSLETDKEHSNLLQPPFEESVKLALIGVSFVGKSSIINCIEQDHYRVDIPPTNGFQLRFKRLRLNNHIINLSVWDGGGDRVLQYIKEGQLQGFDGLLYVFDLSDPQSMANLEQLHFQIKQTYSEDTVSLLIGNKSDLLINNRSSLRQNESDFLARVFSRKKQMKYMKISAKDNHFVTDCFVEVIKEVLRGKLRVRTSRRVEEKEIVDTPEQSSFGTATSCSRCSCCIY